MVTIENEVTKYLLHDLEQARYTRGHHGDTREVHVLVIHDK
jgi:hypothetical protein